MAKSYSIALIGGDGTGPEVAREAVKVLQVAEPGGGGGEPGWPPSHDRASPQRGLVASWPSTGGSRPPRTPPSRHRRGHRSSGDTSALVRRWLVKGVFLGWLVAGGRMDSATGVVIADEQRVDRVCGHGGVGGQQRNREMSSLGDEQPVEGVAVDQWEVGHGEGVVVFDGNRGA